MPASTTSDSTARVVILGAGGFIGGALASGLTTHSIPFVAPRKSELDLTSPESIDALAGLLSPDHTLVFAASIPPDEEDDIATFMRNVAMAYHVASALELVRCKHVLYLSSVAVYGTRHPGPWSEHALCDPHDLYGVMHLTREKLLRSVCASLRVPFAVLRLSSVYGPGDTHDRYGPNRFMTEIADSAGLTLFGEGQDLRDHVYIEDVVVVLLRALERRLEGVFNLASGQSTTFAAIADIFDQLVDGPLKRRMQPRAVAPAHLHYDVSSLHQAFPEVTWTPLTKGIALALAERNALCRRTR